LNRNTSTSIPFILVTGFLGSGKTTLLKRFLDVYSSNKKIGIIQNEFAAGNVDGTELQQTGKSFEILEINKGSVFCVCLLSDFQKSLTDFIDQINPELIILEATGLADPIAIGQILQAPDLSSRTYLDQVWCVIDATNFLKMEKSMTRIQHQVRVADIVIVNKTDIQSDNLNQIKEKINELNPFAEIIATSYCELDLEQHFLQKKIPTAITHQKEIESISPGERPDIMSKVIRTHRKYSQKQLDQIVEEIAPKTFRLKGFVNLDDESVVAIQSCFGKTEVRQIENYTGPTEIIIMGPDLGSITKVLSNK
jgi:G3E family GTPase